LLFVTKRFEGHLQFGVDHCMGNFNNYHNDTI